MGRAQILVVEGDADVRDRIGSWLEDDGFEVTGCPGPGRPDYNCIAARTQRCPLANEADVVVLDMQLAGDLAMEGTPAEALLLFYTWAGKNVVALRHGDEPTVRDEYDDILFQRWPPEKDGLLEAVHHFAG